MVKVCLFGSYTKSTNGVPSNNTGDLIKEICRSHGLETVECHEACDSRRQVIGAYVRLFLRHRRIDYDVMVIPWRGVITLPLAKLVHRGPIVYFAAMSIYDTLVNARKKIPKNSLRARFTRFVDKTACRWADLVVTESTFQIEYFVREFGLPKGKFRQLWPSAYEPLFVPRQFKKRADRFVVLYFGMFIPATGVQTIAEAAARLLSESDVTFILCGDGQDRPRIRKYVKQNRITNVELPGIVPVPSLMRYIEESDVCLGMFDAGEKCQGSMPNKVNQALASARPLITMDTPTAREAGLVDGENCLLTRSDSPEELARCILRLRDDDGLRRNVALQGRRHYLERLSVDRAGRQLALHIEHVCGRQKA